MNISFRCGNCNIMDEREKLSLSTGKNKKHNTSSTKGKYIRDSTFSPKLLTHTL